MAVPTIDTNSAVTKKLWSEKFFRDVPVYSYWTKLGGVDFSMNVDAHVAGGQDSVMAFNREWDQKGDTITFTLVPRLNKPLIKNGNLEGNETSINPYTFQAKLAEYGFAVRDGGMLQRQRTWFNLDDKQREMLLVNVAEGFDLEVFNALWSAPTKVVVAGTTDIIASATSAASAITNVTSDNKISMNQFRVYRSVAKTGFNRQVIPLSPIMDKGKQFYGMLLHPDGLADLQNDPLWVNAVKEAEVRSSDNPIFTNAVAVINGIIIHDHERVPVGTTGGATGDVSYQQGLLFGKDAITVGFCGTPELVEGKFDYNREHGLAWIALASIAKPVFNSQDYGSFQIVTACGNYRNQ